MTTTEIEEKVRKWIVLWLDVEPQHVTRTARFVDDLGADSLAIVELVLAVEEQFEFDVPDEDTERLITVGDAIDYIEKRCAK